MGSISNRFVKTVQGCIHTLSTITHQTRYRVFILVESNAICGIYEANSYGTNHLAYLARKLHAIYIYEWESISRWGSVDIWWNEITAYREYHSCISRTIKMCPYFLRLGLPFIFQRNCRIWYLYATTVQYLKHRVYLPVKLFVYLNHP